MFPRPIEHAPVSRRIIYQVMLPISLLVWLLPLLAIFMTSIRSAKDINSGNVFGWPSSFDLVANYSGVFIRSNAGQYFLNSIWITVPTVALSISLACLAGYALAIYKFRASVPLFFLFIAGNFVPFQILMVPVRELSVQTGPVQHGYRSCAVSCGLPDRLLHIVHAQLYPRPAVRTDRKRTH
jgi:multiple sugar transport system permease protein